MKPARLVETIKAILFLFIYVVAINGSYAQDKPDASSLRGKELFVENRCANCHTIGRGRFVGPDLAGVGNRYAREKIREWIIDPQSVYRSKGQMPMNEGYPPMPTLGVPADEAQSITDYLLSVKALDVADSEGGVIKGRLINKTTDEAAAGVELSLTSYLGERPQGEEKSKTDGKGQFSFDGLAWDRSYAVSLTYKGAQYVTDKLVFYPEEDTRTLDLPVYDPTEGDADISVEADHMVVQIAQEGISIAEIMVLHNGGKQIYVGAQGENNMREVLRFDLPEKASDLQFLEGLDPESIVRTEEGFVDTSPFSPGIKRAIYAYRVPFEAGKHTIEKNIFYRTKGFILLVSDSGIDVNVDGLAGGDAVEVNGDRFIRWTGTGLSPATRIRIELGKPLFGKDSFKWVALGTVLLMIVAGLIYSLGFKGKDNPETNQLFAREGLLKERERLILEIAELDDRFEEGKISEAEYRRKREERKRELISLMEKLENLSPSGF